MLQWPDLATFKKSSIIDFDLLRRFLERFNPALVEIDDWLLRTKKDQKLLKSRARPPKATLQRNIKAKLLKRAKRATFQHLFPLFCQKALQNTVNPSLRVNSEKKVPHSPHIGKWTLRPWGGRLDFSKTHRKVRRVSQCHNLRGGTQKKRSKNTIFSTLSGGTWAARTLLV